MPQPGCARSFAMAAHIPSSAPARSAASAPRGVTQARRGTTCQSTPSSGAAFGNLLRPRAHHPSRSLTLEQHRAWNLVAPEGIGACPLRRPQSGAAHRELVALPGMGGRGEAPAPPRGQPENVDCQDRRQSGDVRCYRGYCAGAGRPCFRAACAGAALALRPGHPSCEGAYPGSTRGDRAPGARRAGPRWVAPGR